ncbi:MAG: RnfH family protein [Sutterellaceae bacterium]|nr:RnfH family protein [Burkholderiaceae bacterium]MCX7901059.1 RnfH family protein [Burkholderiaceae bacterium]MDW8431050.1 RnfH family protein [Sutterellaceae bacterium]
MRITVVYCPPGTVWQRDVELAPGATVAHALEASGVLAAFPHLADEPLQVGIYGRTRPLQTTLADGDRVEIYRPLIIDPKEARRRRAQLRRRKEG